MEIVYFFFHFFLLIGDTFLLFIIFCHLKCTKLTPIILKIATFFHLCYKRHFLFCKSCTCLFDTRTVLTVSKIDFWKTHIYIFQKKSQLSSALFLFNHLEVFKCIYNSFSFFSCYLWHFCFAFTCVIVFPFYNSKFTFYLRYI